MPELSGLRTQRVGRDDPGAIAAAGEALASCYDPGVPPRFAVAAISYAVAPVIIAATMPPGDDRIALIVGIGGYHDVIAAITYLTTGYYRQGPGQPWHYGSAGADRQMGVRPCQRLADARTEKIAPCSARSRMPSSPTPTPRCDASRVRWAAAVAP